MTVGRLPVDDVVRVARAREDSVTLAQIAKDLRLHEMTLSKWMRQAEMVPIAASVGV